MFLCNILFSYLLVGAMIGVVNYVAMWRAFRREGRCGELPGWLLEKSVCWHAVAWPSLVFWWVLLLLTVAVFPKRHK